MSFDIKNLFQQAQKMQADIQNMKTELSNRSVNAESGGGMVTALMTGDGKLKHIKISPRRKCLRNPDWENRRCKEI